MCRGESTNTVKKAVSELSTWPIEKQVYIANGVQTCNGYQYDNNKIEKKVCKEKGWDSNERIMLLILMWVVWYHIQRHFSSVIL